MEEELVVQVSRETGKTARRMLEVGRGSSIRFLVAGVPSGLSNVKFHVGRPGGGENYAVVPAQERQGGVWHVYASGLNFPDVGVTRYHITARDEHDGSVWLGSGRLVVSQSVMNGADGAADSLIPEDTYIRNPETGLWHRLTVKLEGGALVPELSTEGVTR